MKKPFLLLPFAFIGLGAFVGCRQDEDASTAASTSAPAETQPMAAKAAPLPTAPLPREKRKASEILIGKWKLVYDGGGAIPESSSPQVEFTNDGKAILIPARKDRETNFGSYKFEGETITVSMPATPRDPAYIYQGKIQSISEKEIVLHGRIKDREPGKSIFLRIDK